MKLILWLFCTILIWDSKLKVNNSIKVSENENQISEDDLSTKEVEKISPGKAKKVRGNMEKISKFELVQTCALQTNLLHFFRYCSLLKKKKKKN